MIGCCVREVVICRLAATVVEYDRVCGVDEVHWKAADWWNCEFYTEDEQFLVILRVTQKLIGQKPMEGSERKSI